MIRLKLIDGDHIDVPEAVIANKEGDFVVCRDETARSVLRIDAERVAAFGKPGHWRFTALTVLTGLAAE